MYYTYIIKCKNGNLYTGITTDVERRFNEHKSKSKSSAKYTRANPVVRIEAVWSSSSRSYASKLESFIKTLERKNKLELISNPKYLNDKYFDKLDTDEYKFESDIMLNVNKKTSQSD